MPEKAKIIPKVFITKYALTKGIIEAKNVEITDAYPDVIRDTTSGFTVYYHKGEWYPDMIQARFKADQMRKKKIENLRKQIKKLDEMLF